MSLTDFAGRLPQSFEDGLKLALAAHQHPLRGLPCETLGCIVRVQLRWRDGVPYEETPVTLIHAIPSHGPTGRRSMRRRETKTFPTPAAIVEAGHSGPSLEAAAWLRERHS